MRGPRLFYGWRMVMAGVIVTAPTAILFNGFSGFLEPVQATFVTTAALASIAYAFLRAETGFAAPVAGFLVDAYGPRPVILIGGICVGLGAVIASVAPSLPVFLLGFFVMALGASFTSAMVSTIAISRWFNRRRGRAFAILALGVPLWAFTVPLVVLAIDTWGWRPTLLWFGLVSMALVVPLSFVYRRSPTEYGLVADGQPSPQPATDSQASAPAMALRKVLRMPAFWFLAVLYGCFTFAITGLFAHLIPILEQTVGLSRTNAGIVAPTVMGMSLGGRLVLGGLADYIHPRYLITVSFGLMLAGMAALLWLPGPWAWILLIAFYGTGSGGWSPLRYTVQGRLFGVGNFGRVLGSLRVVDAVVGMPAPILMGLIRDTTGTYEPGLVVFVVLMAIATPLAMGLRTRGAEAAGPVGGPQG